MRLCLIGAVVGVTMASTSTNVREPIEDTPNLATLSTPITFTPAGKIIYGGRNYVVPISLDIDDLFEITKPVMRGLKKIRESYESVSHRAMQQWFPTSLRNHISLLISDLCVRTKELRALLSAMLQKQPGLSRPKRGVFDGVGTLGSYLFGVATEDELQETQNVVDRLNDLSEEERNMLNVHSHILNVTLLHLDDVEANQQRTLAAIDEIQANVNYLNASLNHSKQEIYNVNNNVKLTSAVSYAATAISDLSIRFLKFIDGLKTLNAGYLSAHIITPEHLQRLVGAIAEQSLRPLWPGTNEYLPLYYEFAHVVPLTTDGFFYFLLLPLLPNPPNAMDLYKVNALVYPLNSNITISYGEVPPYFGASADHSVHVSLSEGDLSTCRYFSQVYFCQEAKALSKGTSFTFIFTLFTNRRVDEVCQKHVSAPLPRPMIIRDAHSWLYATSQVIYITTVCPNKDTRTDILPIGVGRISVPANCRINAEEFLLPVSGDIQAPKVEIVHQTSVTLFNVSLSLSETEVVDMFANDTIYNGMLNIVNRPIPLAALTGELKNLRALRNRSKLLEHTSYFAATMTIILLILFAGMIICVRWAKQALEENRDIMGRPNGKPGVGGWGRFKENITRWIVPNFGATGNRGNIRRSVPDLQEYIPLASPRGSRGTGGGNEGPCSGGGAPACPSTILPGRSHLGSTIHDGTVTAVNIERSFCSPQCTPKTSRNPTFQSYGRN